MGGDKNKNKMNKKKIIIGFLLIGLAYLIYNVGYVKGTQDYRGCIRDNIFDRVVWNDNPKDDFELVFDVERCIETLDKFN